MIRIDGFYLYTIGYSLHPLSEMKASDAFNKWGISLYVAQGSLETFLQRSVFQFRTCQAAGNNLLEAIKPLTVDQQRTDPINMYEAYMLTSALNEFEHVLGAELSMMNIYLVVKKRGYDTSDLIHNGSVLFPPDLIAKVPEAIEDAMIATKCIAFELPTAAAFHLHRANESVLHIYYDAVSKHAPRPIGRNIGDYLKAMREQKVGEDKVLSALKDLKDLHRNPLIHPDQSLSSTDEAIALLGSVQAAMVGMLKWIPDPPPTVAAGPSV